MGLEDGLWEGGSVAGSMAWHVWRKQESSPREGVLVGKSCALVGVGGQGAPGVGSSSRGASAMDMQAAGDGGGQRLDSTHVQVTAAIPVGLRGTCVLLHPYWHYPAHPGDLFYQAQGWGQGPQHSHVWMTQSRVLPAAGPEVAPGLTSHWRGCGCCSKPLPQGLAQDSPISSPGASLSCAERSLCSDIPGVKVSIDAGVNSRAPPWFLAGLS